MLFPLENESKKETETAVDNSRLQQLEEKVLIEAIQNTFQPGLSVSDAYVFATLIIDVFQNADAETMFQCGSQEKVPLVTEPELLSTAHLKTSTPSISKKGNYLCYRYPILKHGYYTLGPKKNYTKKRFSTLTCAF